MGVVELPSAGFFYKVMGFIPLLIYSSASALYVLLLCEISHRSVWEHTGLRERGQSGIFHLEDI